jgi:hypothetical protein
VAEEFDGDYSEIADAQLDKIEASGDIELYNAILEVCHDIFDDPSLARHMSTAITTDVGIRMRLPVPGKAPYKVFWNLQGPRIEAVFPYEPRYDPDVE